MDVNNSFSVLGSINSQVESHLPRKTLHSCKLAAGSVHHLLLQVSWVLSGAGSPQLVSGSAFAQSLKMTIALLQEVDLEREKTNISGVITQN